MMFSRHIGTTFIFVQQLIRTLSLSNLSKTLSILSILCLQRHFLTNFLCAVSVEFPIQSFKNHPLSFLNSDRPPTAAYRNPHNYIHIPQPPHTGTKPIARSLSTHSFAHVSPRETPPLHSISRTPPRPFGSRRRSKGTSITPIVTETTQTHSQWRVYASQ